MRRFHCRTGNQIVNCESLVSFLLRNGNIVNPTITNHASGYKLKANEPDNKRVSVETEIEGRQLKELINRAVLRIDRKLNERNAEFSTKFLNRSFE